MRKPTHSDRVRIGILLKAAPAPLRAGMAANLATLRSNCRVDEDTGCWIWLRGTSTAPSKSRAPAARVWIGGAVRPAGRVAWELAGLPLEPGQFVCRSVCVNVLCINPLHGCACTVQEKQAALGAAGRFHSPERGVRMAAASLRRALPRERVQHVEQLLASGMPTVEVATQVGVSKNLVKRIRQGKHAHSAQRAPGLPASSIFTMGVAR